MEVAHVLGYFAKFPKSTSSCGLPEMSFKLPKSFSNFLAVQVFFSKSAQSFSPENQTLSLSLSLSLCNPQSLHYFTG
jgi:hypothetical protein